MGERKVLNKYYPWDFDPKLLGKPKLQKNSQVKVRMMLPMSIMCTNCGEYIGVGTKFNSKKETVEKERYLNIDVYRFYMRCSRCSAEFTIKTDPKNSDYLAEFGCTRSYEPWKEHEEKVKEQEIEEKETELDAIKQLENKTTAGKNEMDMLDDLDEIRTMNAQNESVSTDYLLEKINTSTNSGAHFEISESNEDKLHVSDLTKEEREKLVEFFGSDSLHPHPINKQHENSSSSSTLSSKKARILKAISSPDEDEALKKIENVQEDENMNIEDLIHSIHQKQDKKKQVLETEKLPETIEKEKETEKQEDQKIQEQKQQENDKIVQKPAEKKAPVSFSLTSDLISGLGDLEFEFVEEKSKKKKKKSKKSDEKKRKRENDEGDVKQVSKKAR